MLNALAAALNPGKDPTPSTHRLRRGLQQECVGGLRRTGNDRGGLRLLPLWGRDQYGQPRPARPVVRRDARRRTRPGLLQLPLL